MGRQGEVGVWNVLLVGGTGSYLFLHKVFTSALNLQVPVFISILFTGSLMLYRHFLASL